MDGARGRETGGKRRNAAKMGDSRKAEHCNIS